MWCQTVIVNCFSQCVCEGQRQICMRASLAQSQTVLLTTRNSLTGVSAEPRPFPRLLQRLEGVPGGQQGELHLGHRPMKSYTTIKHNVLLVVMILLVLRACLIK